MVSRHRETSDVSHANAKFVNRFTLTDRSRRRCEIKPENDAIGDSTTILEKIFALSTSVSALAQTKAVSVSAVIHVNRIIFDVNRQINKNGTQVL